MIKVIKNIISQSSSRLILYCSISMILSYENFIARYKTATFAVTFIFLIVHQLVYQYIRIAFFRGVIILYVTILFNFFFVTTKFIIFFFLLQFTLVFIYGITHLLHRMTSSRKYMQSSM